MASKVCPKGAKRVPRGAKRVALGIKRVSQGAKRVVQATKRAPSRCLCEARNMFDDVFGQFMDLL